MAGDVRPFGELFAENPRNGLTRPKSVRGAGVKMVNMGELFAYPRLRNAPMDRVPLSEAEAENVLLKPGDLLFARQSLVLEGAGKCSIFLNDDEPVTFESHVTRVRLDPREADSRFYFYYLQSHHGRAAISSIVEQGAGASGIRGSDLERLDVLWRPVPEQCAIAHILGTLDDKIELNRRMSETLEAMARALFKSWFVDFDPVRAKAEGRDPGLSQPLVNLFPRSFKDSQLGVIPKGWKATTWGNLATLEYGKSLDDYAGDHQPYPVYGTNGRIGSHSAPLCQHPGVVIGRKGAYRGVHFCSTPFFVIDTAFYLEPKAATELRWGYYELLRHNINGMDSGSAIPSTSREDFYGLSVLHPPHDVQRAFVQLMGPLWTRQEQNIQESASIAALRDGLLPKLISGELRLSPKDRARGCAQGGCDA